MYVGPLGATPIVSAPGAHQREIAVAPAPEIVPVTVVDPPTGFWSQYGGEIIVGVVTSALGAVATYFAMRAVERR